MAELISNVILNEASVFDRRDKYTNYYKNLFNKMKTNNLIVERYIAPEMEVVSTVVEAGFTASFGDAGEAGQRGIVSDYDGEL